ncbi:MAG: glucokinase, partial [Rhodospirillaceae bacterium]
NHNWEFSAAEIQAQFGLDRVHIINDFTAISLSLANLPPASLESIGPVVDVSHATCFGVVGPGTGLGMGGLLRIGKQSIPLPSEGGHTSFAAVDDTELNIARILINRFGHVSNERVLSGPGLVNIYEALNALTGKSGVTLNPEQITERALARTDTTCLDALNHFCAFLGSVAGDLALLLCAEAVYIAGGIVPRIIDFFRASGFRARFENKGRFAERMTQIPTFVITEPNPGLLGAAVDLLQLH